MEFDFERTVSLMSALNFPDTNKYELLSDKKIIESFAETICQTYNYLVQK